MAVIRRGVNSGKVIEEGFAGKFKRWRYSEKMNGFHNIYRKTTIFTIYFSILDSEGKSGISFI